MKNQENVPPVKLSKENSRGWISGRRKVIPV